jgi:hypothetical protein
MPLKWRRGENPYLLSYFGRLQIGAHASPRQINAQVKNLTRQIKGGGEVRAGDRVISRADLTEAEARLLDQATWAAEVLLVHAGPGRATGHLPALCAAVTEAAALASMARPLPLADLTALAPLIPRPQAADLPRPSWGEFPVSAPDGPQDLAADIQFDL